MKASTFVFFALASASEDIFTDEGLALLQIRASSDANSTEACLEPATSDLWTLGQVRKNKDGSPAKSTFGHLNTQPPEITSEACCRARALEWGMEMGDGPSPFSGPSPGKGCYTYQVSHKIKQAKKYGDGLAHPCKMFWGTGGTDTQNVQFNVDNADPWKTRPYMTIYAECRNPVRAQANLEAKEAAEAEAAETAAAEAEPSDAASALGDPHITTNVNKHFDYTSQ